MYIYKCIQLLNNLAVTIQLLNNPLLNNFMQRLNCQAQLKVKKCCHHLLYDDVISFFVTSKCQKIQKIDENS